jgi:hypothetical protein
MSATDLDLLRDIQRTLRLNEIAGRVSDEAKALRSRVIERMAMLARRAS